MTGELQIATDTRTHRGHTGPAQRVAFISAVAMVIATMATQSSEATTLTWDSAAAAGVQSGAAIWDFGATANTNWTSNNGTSRVNWTSNGDIARFELQPATGNLAVTIGGGAQPA